MSVINIFASLTMSASERAINDIEAYSEIYSQTDPDTSLEMASEMSRGINSGTGNSFGDLGDLFGHISDGSMMTMLIILGISLLVAVIVFVLVVEKKKAPKSKFMVWLREYLNFRKMLVAGMMKFAYLFLSVFITVTGVAVMFSGGSDMAQAVVSGLAIIIVGNLVLRLISEFFMLAISLWQNTTDIRAVIVKEEESSESSKGDKISKKDKAMIEKALAADSGTIKKENETVSDAMDTPEVGTEEKPTAEASAVETAVVEAVETPVAEAPMAEAAVVEAVETPVVTETPSPDPATEIPDNPVAPPPEVQPNQ